MKLEIIKKTNWAGVSKYTGTTDVISPALNGKTGEHITGLTKEDERYFETELGLKLGELKARSPFWETYSLVIPIGGIEINKDNVAFEQLEPTEQLLIKFLKAHPLVAPSYAQMFKDPKYRYVLIDEQEVAETKNKEREATSKAFSILHGLSLEQVVGVLKVLGYQTESMNYASLYNAVGTLVEQDPKKFLEVVEDNLLAMKVLVVDAVNKGIFKKTKGKMELAPIFYEETFLGEGIEDAARALGSNAFQGTLIAVRQFLANKDFKPSKESKEVTALVQAKKRKINDKISEVIAEGTDSGELTYE